MESQPYAHIPSLSTAAPVPSRKRRQGLAITAGLLVACVVAALCIIALNTSGGASRASGTNRQRQATYQNSDDGIYVKITNGNYQVELAVASLTAFRVSLTFTKNTPKPIDNPMVAPQSQKAPFSPFTNGDIVGIRASFGSVSINQTSGAFVLSDASGNVITTSPGLARSQGSAKAAKGDTCARIWAGQDVSGPGKRTPGAPNGLSGQTQATCCAACNNDVDCAVWVLAAPGHESDGKNCWLLVDSGISTVPNAYRTVGGDITPPTPVTAVSFSKNSNTKFYGAGCGSGNARQLAQVSAYSKVTNTEFYSPHYYSTDGYAALVVSYFSYRDSTIYAYPVQWDATSSNQVTWNIEGSDVDIYLVPASSHGDALSKYWDLTGRPVVPPRYAFGFTASRWGWTDYNYVNSMLSQFRSGNFPIDSWISDFEWYTPEPDYSLPEAGSPTFQDFTYNSVVFPDPVNDISDSHTKYHLRFGGIRKPRLGNSDLLVMAKAKGWTVAADHAGGAPGGTRNLNYSVPELRDWYQNQTAHFLHDGVDFYWNDEGETYYFAFHDWNQAQYDGLQAFDPRKRFYTINRSYTPGLQRLGATVWTGDVQVSWDSLREQPGYLANWGLAGAPYMTCDTGGFNGGYSAPLLLSRWYFVSAFLPIMRVHSSLDDTPHFPFLYPQDAADAMRTALNLRYQFVPYHYSLAHQMYQPGGLPIFRPMLMHYQDPSVQEMTAQWMDGESVLVCPVMNEDNSTSCYLPANTKWFNYNTASSHDGGITLNIETVALDLIPLFVLAGSILPIAPLVQYTDLLPAGPINVHVYGGADASFTMIEDDGESTDYQVGASRATTFTWIDSSKTLTWSVSGVFRDEHTFTQLKVSGFFLDRSTKQSPVIDIGASGSYQF